MSLTVDDLFAVTGRDYDELQEEFEWAIPDQFNVAASACDRWVDDSDRPAIYTDDGQTYTFADIQAKANRLANYLVAAGISEGDRVGVVMAQRPETVVAHLGIWKIGAVSVPGSILHGPESLSYRFNDSETSLVVGDANSAAPLEAVLDAEGSVEQLLLADDLESEHCEINCWATIDSFSTSFETCETAPTDDLCIVYTSGTTGEPKGALHGHQFLLGNLPLFALAVSGGERGDVYWTPSEWSWVASLFSIVFPALYYGRPVLATGSDRFDPEDAFRLIEDNEITNCLVPATALRKMAGVADTDRYDTSSLDVICSGGEAVSDELVTWVDETFEGAVIHEAYGQTEANSLVGECHALFDPEPGAIGRPMLGHDIRIVDPDERSRFLDAGEVGEIAIRCETDPICFKKYLNSPEATAEKCREGWLFTEDLGVKSEAGYVAFQGRKDDIIISAGYRIHPDEVEDHISTHPAVANVVVAGVTDDERGEAVKAFIELANEDSSVDDVVDEIKQLVKKDLAAYAYPREVEIVDEFPTSPAGKIQRAELLDQEESNTGGLPGRDSC